MVVWYFSAKPLPENSWSWLSTLVDSGRLWSTLVDSGRLGVLGWRRLCHRPVISTSTMWSWDGWYFPWPLDIGSFPEVFMRWSEVKQRSMKGCDIPCASRSCWNRLDIIAGHISFPHQIRNRFETVGHIRGCWWHLQKKGRRMCKESRAFFDSHGLVVPRSMHSYSHVKLMFI